jgi:hypothetical protein
MCRKVYFISFLTKTVTSQLISLFSCLFSFSFFFLCNKKANNSINSSLYRTKTNIQTANDYGNDTNLNTISCNFLNNNNLSHTNNNNNNNNQSQNQNNNNNIQWNLWQQFQWPYVQPEQNRWSKSILLAHEFFFLFIFVVLSLRNCVFF